jgi:hypothetical protein
MYFLLLHSLKFNFLSNYICIFKAAPVIEFLIQSYPKYVTVEELPMNTIQEKVIKKKMKSNQSI